VAWVIHPPAVRTSTPVRGRHVKGLFRPLTLLLLLVFSSACAGNGQGFGTYTPPEDVLQSPTPYSEPNDELGDQYAPRGTTFRICTDPYCSAVTKHRYATVYVWQCRASEARSLAYAWVIIEIGGFTQKVHYRIEVFDRQLGGFGSASFDTLAVPAGSHFGQYWLKIPYAGELGKRFRCKVVGGTSTKVD
jgi:hypothetical protein